jgi:hypothetical protein
MASYQICLGEIDYSDPDPDNSSKIARKKKYKTLTSNKKKDLHEEHL